MIVFCGIYPVVHYVYVFSKVDYQKFLTRLIYSLPLLRTTQNVPEGVEFIMDSQAKEILPTMFKRYQACSKCRLPDTADYIDVCPGCRYESLGRADTQ
jgi:hypothetical protein